MLGFPLGDSMRCKLLLGFSVILASCSNPMVALTRSLRMSRAVSGSPLRNSVAASSRSALANWGSRSTRSITVCLKLRVNTICSPFCFLRRRQDFLPFFVFGVQHLGLVNILLLTAFRASTKQNDEFFTVSRQVDAVTWPPVDDVFTDSAKPLHA